MSKEIRADYTQQYLLPPCLEDWVPADHPARYIREIVDTMDCGRMGFVQKQGEEGRPHYAVDMLLKVWVYGYFNQIYSCRKLEQACREHMSLVWLTGDNAPDHNTLWRFHRDNKDALKKFYKGVVRVALGAGMVGFVLHALDGTKIHAAASARGAMHKEDLEKRLKELDNAIDALTQRIEEAGGKEDSAAYSLPEELRQQQCLRQAIMDNLSLMRQQDTVHLQPQDTDARMMKTPQGTAFAYNGQAVVDEQSGLIVAEDVVNDANDSHVLVHMLEEAEDTLGVTAGKTLADGGYAAGGQIAGAQEAGYDTLMPIGPKDAGRYHALNFEYDAAQDAVICPEGKLLTYERTKAARRGTDTLRIYRCHCGGVCPNRSACTKDKRGRMIEAGPHFEAVRRQRRKLLNEDNRCKLKRRGAIVERVFAAIKEQMRFRRWTAGGLDNVRAQWSLVCAAFNLKKMYAWWAQGRLLPD